MPNNYILLETIALTQNAASVTFDNLPTSGYTDLKIVVSGRSDRNTFSWTNIKVQFNGSASGYTYRNLLGDGSSASSVNNTNDGEGSTGIMVFSLDQANSTASTFGNAEIYIPNYRSSTNKSVSADGVMELNGTNASIGLTAGLWSNTAAITSITLTPQISGSTFNFVANSTFSLYGVAALGTTPVLAPKATGGNIVANDGTYWYHAFTSSGNFVPQVGLTADVLVVAGGGGPGNGGGGGAGGLLAFNSQSFTTTNYACTIGAGGVLNTSNGSATNGNDSQFGNLTLVKGGGGGNASGGAGLAGGSGGGAYNTGTGGAPTSGQGNAGGNGASQTNAVAGGGGAGAVGSSPSGGVGGAGGAGTTSAISGGSATGLGQLSGGSYYFAGGGGGGGSGGGGTGGVGGGASGNNGSGASGTVNTGGGAGGFWSSYATAQNGGSGVIIVRYPIN